MPEEVVAQSENHSQPQLVQPMPTFDEWKRNRGTYIGGSDAAAILGLAPEKYGRTIGEVWIEKVRAQERLEAGDETIDPDMETRFTRWGKRQEGVILDEYQDVMGFEVRRPGLALFRHPELPFIGGTIDGDAVTPFSDKRIVEAKTTDAWVQFREQIWGPTGSDIVPEWYLVQLMVYLIVRRHEGYTLGDFAVLIGGNDFRIFHIEYDAELAEMIVDALSQFWRMVLERRAPSFDYQNKNAVNLQRRIWNKVDGTSIVVPLTYRLTPESPTVIDLWLEHDHADEEAKAAEARRDAAKAQLLTIAGNNALVEIEGTSLAIKRTEVAGYPVAAYEVPPRIGLSFSPRLLEKRKGLLNAAAEEARKQISDSTD